MSRKRLPASEQADDELVEECIAGKDDLDSIHETIARFWARFGDPPDERWRMLFEVAVAEVAANIVEHALPSQVTFRLRAGVGSVTADFFDSGRAWGGPRQSAGVHDLMDERGRGLAMASVAVDEVVYERSGGVNHWRLVKRL